MCNNLSFTFLVCVVWVQSNLPMNKRKFRLYTGILIKQIAFVVYETCMCKRPSKIVQKVTKIAIAYIFIQLLLTLLFFFGYVHSKMRLLFTNVPQSFKWYRCFSRLGIWAQSWSFHVRMRDLIIFWLMSDGNHDQKQPAFYNNFFNQLFIITFSNSFL